MKTLLTLLASSLIHFAFGQQVIVQLEPTANINAIIAAQQEASKQKPLAKKQLSQVPNIWLLEMEDAKAQLPTWAQAKGVIALQQNQALTARNLPNDRLFKEQWQYENSGLNNGQIDADIDADAAWEITTGGHTAAGDEIVVAVIDGGVNANHPDLKNNIWKNRNEIPDNNIDDDQNGFVDDVLGWNFIDNNNDVTNQGFGSWHGTPVAGIIGAEGNNGLGVSGINWQVKVMNLVGGKTDADIIAAYAYVLEMRRIYNRTNGEKGAFIVATNASFGRSYAVPSDAPIWCAIYDELGSAGVLSVGATANDNVDVDLVGDLPTTCPSPYLISVTNTNRYDKKETYAGYGAIHIDLGAPGEGTLTLDNFGGYDRFGGTSGATPHVAGAIALIYSLDIPEFMNDTKGIPSFSAKLVKNALLNSVDPLLDLEGKTVSGGRLNLHKALKAIQQHYQQTPIAKEKPTLTINNIYPNPTKENLGITITTPSNQDLRIALYDTKGIQVIPEKKAALEAGKHYIQLPVNMLAPGIYIVQLRSEYEGGLSARVVIHP